MIGPSTDLVTLMASRGRQDEVHSGNDVRFGVIVAVLLKVQVFLYAKAVSTGRQLPTI